MKAAAFFPEETEVRIIDKERPIPNEGEALIRTLFVGIDGSDRRITSGEVGGDTPEGDDYLILGHEAVGVVEDPNGTKLEEGEIVAPLVRLPQDNQSRWAENGELDMAPPDAIVERGIFGAHGYMAEFFTSRPEYLVPIPESRAEYGFFVEPASLVEKALEQTFAARSTSDWQPSSAFVLGNGNLGLLGLSRLETGDEFDRTYCLGRRDRPDPTIDFIEAVGGTYVDARETALEDFPSIHEPADFVFETTGYAKHAFEAVDALGQNGVATLQGLPGSRTFEIDGGAWHSELIVSNKALLGVINSRRHHFEDAVEWLSETPESILDRLVSGVYSLNGIDEAFADSDETIKTVVSFEKTPLEAESSSKGW